MSKDKSPRITGAEFEGVPWYIKSIDIRYMHDQELTPDAQALITYNLSREMLKQDWVLRKKAMSNYLGSYKCKKALNLLKKRGYACLIRRTDPVSKKRDVSGWFISIRPDAQLKAQAKGYTVLFPLPVIPEPLLDNSVITRIEAEWNGKNDKPTRKSTGCSDYDNPLENQLGVENLQTQSKIAGHIHNTKEIHSDIVLNTDTNNYFLTENNVIASDNGEQKKKKGNSSVDKRKKRFSHIPKGTQRLLYEKWVEIYKSKLKTEEAPSLSQKKHLLLGTVIPEKIIKELVKSTSAKEEEVPKELIVIYFESILNNLDEGQFAMYYGTPDKIARHFETIIAIKDFREVKETGKKNGKSKLTPRERLEIAKENFSKLNS